MDLDQKLFELYIELPEPAEEKGCVTQITKLGKCYHIDGLLPVSDGLLVAKGMANAHNIDKLKQAAKACVVQAFGLIAAQEKGSINKVKRLVRVEGFIMTDSLFSEHEKVFQAAAEFLEQILGKKAKHSQSLLGVASLPRQASVMMNMLVEMK